MRGGAGGSYPKVHKAIVLVAGLGTRLLPATKSQPKEMLPVGRKPTVQYVVEELAEAGVEEILFVTGRTKRSIEDHFDHDEALTRRLAARNRENSHARLPDEELHVRFLYTRQGSPMGTAHAVLQGREFAGRDTFIVVLGDSIIKGRGTPDLLRRMIERHRAHGASATLAVERLPLEQVVRYGVVQPRDRVDDDFEVADVVEKPSPESAPSDLALAGRYIFEPSLFDRIVRTVPRPSGELYLPDTIRLLIREGHMVRAVRLLADEKRYDIGNFESYFKAFIDFALEDEEYGSTVLEHVRERVERHALAEAT